MTTLAQITFVALIVAFTIAVGVGLYEAFFIMPAWFANPPQSLALINNRPAATKFWIPIQIVIVLLFIAALILNWSNPTRRMLIIGALTVYVLTAIVSGAYFAPIILKLGKAAGNGAFSPALAAQGNAWLMQSWFRHGALALGELLLLVGLIL